MSLPYDPEREQAHDYLRRVAENLERNLKALSNISDEQLQQALSHIRSALVYYSAVGIKDATNKDHEFLSDMLAMLAAIQHVLSVQGR